MSTEEHTVRCHQCRLLKSKIKAKYRYFCSTYGTNYDRLSDKVASKYHQ